MIQADAVLVSVDLGIIGLRNGNVGQLRHCRVVLLTRKERKKQGERRLMGPPLQKWGINNADSEYLCERQL